MGWASGEGERREGAMVDWGGLEAMLGGAECSRVALIELV